MTTSPTDFKLTAKDIQSYKEGNLVDLWLTGAWDGPYKIDVFRLDPPRPESKCAAYLELSKVHKSEQESQDLVEPEEPAEPEKLDLIEGEAKTIRKYSPPEAKRRFTVKRVKT